MKRVIVPLIALTIILLLGSCNSAKEVAYFQNADKVSLEASRMLYDAKIMPKDQLTITVITTDPQASAPFNLSVSNTIGTTGQLSVGSGSLQGYLVDNSGNITFPVIGKIHVAGMTKSQCEDLILSKLKPYLSETEHPVVTVRMASYRVTVLGEVQSPKVVPVTTEKMSILEALAQAGDLTIYGKRTNVMLIREDAQGEKHNIFNSPYYYLQQNDIIYVQPNNIKAKNSDIGSSTTIWTAFVSVAISIASLVVNILN